MSGDPTKNDFHTDLLLGRVYRVWQEGPIRRSSLKVISCLNDSIPPPTTFISEGLDPGREKNQTVIVKGLPRRDIERSDRVMLSSLEGLREVYGPMMNNRRGLRFVSYIKRWMNELPRLIFVDPGPRPPLSECRGNGHHYHRHTYVCVRCGHQDVMRRLVPGDRYLDCRQNGHYCVSVTAIEQCHQCAGILVPIGQWPDWLEWVK